MKRIASILLLFACFSVGVLYLERSAPISTPTHVVLSDSPEDYRRIFHALKNGQNVEIRVGAETDQPQHTNRIISFGPLDSGRVRQHQDRLQQTLKSFETRVTTSTIPESREEIVNHLRDMRTIELTRAKLETLRAGDAFFSDTIPKAPTGFLMPASATSVIHIDPTTGRRIRDLDAYLATQESDTEVIEAKPFIVYPIDLQRFPMISHYADEIQRLQRIGSMDAAAKFNSRDYEERKRIFEEDRRLRKAILACDIRTESGAARKQELELRWLREGIPAGLLVTSDGYYARSRR